MSFAVAINPVLFSNSMFMRLTLAMQQVNGFCIMYVPVHIASVNLRVYEPIMLCLAFADYALLSL
jgi:hypothetical protein